MFPGKELFGVVDLDIVSGKERACGLVENLGARAGEKNGARFCGLKKINAN